MAFLVRKTYFSWEIKNRLCLRLTNDCITCFTGTLQIFANCLTRQYRGTRNVVSFLIQTWVKCFVLAPHPLRPPHYFRRYFRRRQLLPAATRSLPTFEVFTIVVDTTTIFSFVFRDEDKERHCRLLLYCNSSGIFLYIRRSSSSVISILNRRDERRR